MVTKINLGSNQYGVLMSLNEHGGYPGRGWIWTNESTTVRILSSLVKRGLVDETLGEQVGSWRRPSSFKINAAGLALIKPELNRRAARVAERQAEAQEQENRAAEAERALKETLERIRPQLAELGIHPDTVTINDHWGRRGILMPAEAAETLVRYAMETR